MKRREPGFEPGEEGLFDLGAYTKVGLIGQGGYGIVIQAIHRLSEQPVALKFVQGSEKKESQKEQRMLRGARLLAQLPRHPNVVPIYTAGFCESGFVQVMEFVNGETLRDLLLREGRLPWQKATQIMDEILAGVTHAHDHGMVHRDLKPRNVQLDADDEQRPRLIDFDLARAPEPSMQLTRPGIVVGTAHYLAPEILKQGRGAEGVQGDVFALGVMLYEMIAGARPFQGKKRMDAVRKILEDDPVPLGEVVPDLPRGLSDLVMQALSKSPRKRFKDARALREALQRVLAGKRRGGAGRRLKSAERSQRRGSSRRLRSRRTRGGAVDWTLLGAFLASSVLVLPLTGFLLS